MSKRPRRPGVHAAVLASLTAALMATALTLPSGSGAGISCFGHAATIVRGAGNDTIHGTTGSDVIVAGGGNDTVAAGNGVDYVCGQGGNDTVDTENGDDFLDGGSG